MSGIEEWLERRGLGEYGALFRKHRIDLGTLSLLDEKDLKDLAIPLGDRKRIVSAIRQHYNQDTATPSPDEHDAESDTRERRLLVVLFCDLVGSTEYASHLDPEDLENILHPYRTTVKAIIEKHDGLTLIYEGDGIKAYFGSKVASEDEQEQTLTAAMEIVDTVSGMKLENGENLRVRIGIATGTVIIGNFDAPMGPNAFGEALHLAARLQALASPGSILVDQATYRAMRYVFQFADAGRHKLKGFDDEIQVWRLVDKKDIGSRFAKRFRNTRLIGREPQLRELVRYWQRVEYEHKGAAVTVCGEAGIGKSRLVYELQTSMSTRPFTSLFFQCSPYHADSVYFPVLETIGNTIGLNAPVTERQKFDRLKKFLSERNVPLERSLGIFLRLFSVNTGTTLESELSESMQEEISRKVLLDYVLALGCRNPLFIFVEDVHWIDATSREFFRDLSSICPDNAILLVMTSREHGDGEIPVLAAPSLNLKRLTTEQSRRLVNELCSGQLMPEEFQTYIERKAEGVPLFIEELASTILDMGLKETDAAMALDGRKEIEMSGILQSSLLSKLDRLGESKGVAQLAATIGREFRVEVLQDIVPISRDSLEKCLEELTAAEIIFEKETEDKQIYVFKHALIQDTARNLLSRQRRESIHRKIAAVLEGRISALANTEPELIAFHYNEGGDYLRASEHWYAAGRKAAKTWAKQEALKFLEKGLEALHKTEDTNSRSRAELDFQLEIGDVLYAKFGYITEEGEKAYRRALELSDLLSDHEATVRALDGLFGIHFNSCHFDETIEISDRLMKLGAEQDQVSARVLGLQFKGMSLFCRGDFAAADRHLAQALTYIDRADEVGSDFPSMALIYLSWTRYIRALPEEAVKCYEEARSIVRVQTPYRKAAALGDGCLLYALMDQPDRVDELVRTLIPLVKKYGFNLWFNIGKFFEGWSVSCHGKAKGLKKMEARLSMLGDQEIDKTFYLGLLARAYINFEEHEKADRTIEAGLAQSRRTHEEYYTAELFRLKASLIRQTSGDIVLCRSLLRQATSCAKSQGATTWVNRAKRDLKELDAGFANG